MYQNRQTNKRILIVEDDQASAEFLASLLDNEGYAVQAFPEAEAALQVLKDESLPDLILLDVMMEGMDGYEMCKLIKEDARLRYIPLIFISGKSSIEEKVLGLKLGADDYLVKPFRNKELLAKIQVLLRIKQLQDQLIHAERLAGIGQLAAGVAHEFNNLIGGMLGYAQLALANLEDRPMVEKAFSVIERSCFRARELTENLILFSGSDNTPTGPGNLKQVLDQCLHLLAKQLKDNRINVELDCRHQGLVALDGNRLLQVMIPLFHNAVRALSVLEEEGERTIRIASSSREDRILIRFCDNGIGVAQEHQERIFEPFFSSHGALGSGETTARGMGLTIALGILSAHNGNIILKTSEAEGTCFEIDLPLYQATEEEEEEQPAGAVGPQASFPLESMVLVVDDEDLFRDLLRDALLHKGIQSLQAASGEEAVRLCREQPVRLVFMDYLMPGMGGIEAAKQIRAFKPDLPIVFISGRSILENLRESLGDAPYSFLAKPFILSELHAVVEEALQQ